MKERIWKIIKNKHASIDPGFANFVEYSTHTNKNKIIHNSVTKKILYANMKDAMNQLKRNIFKSINKIVFIVKLHANGVYKK